MDLRDTLRASITGVLTHIDELTCDNLIEFILTKGVKKIVDVRHITYALLSNHLDHVDASELSSEWQRLYNAPTTSSAGSSTQQPSSSGRERARAPLANLSTNAREILAPQMPIFDIDSPYLPAEVRAAIKAKIRPSSRAREDMVRRIVDHCRETVPNLQRSSFNKVALQLVTSFKESFQDTVLVSEHGSDSLAFQMRTKFDNDRRADKCLTAQERNNPNIKEAYGCLQWMPDMPDGETEESLTATKDQLKQMHKIAPRDWDWKVIRRKMTSSYFLQRKEINGSLTEPKATSRKRKRNETENNENEDDPQSSSNLTIIELRESWPFLFTAKGISLHFKILTGVDFKEVLTAYVTNSGPRLVSFFSSGRHSTVINDCLQKIKRRMDLETQRGNGSVTLCGILLMLIRYFDEDKDSLFLCVERTTSLDDAADSVTFSDEKTPVLIIAGTSLFDFDSIFFAVDNKVLCAANNIADGILLLFASYFVFNYVYSSKLASFLNFIQRVIAEIQPSTGSKFANSTVARKANDKVVKLSNKLKVFNQKCDEEEAEDSD